MLVGDLRGREAREVGGEAAAGRLSGDRAVAAAFASGFDTLLRRLLRPWRRGQETDQAREFHFAVEERVQYIGDGHRGLTAVGLRGCDPQDFLEGLSAARVRLSVALCGRDLGGYDGGGLSAQGGNACAA